MIFSELNMWEALLPALSFLILGVDAHANMVSTKNDHQHLPCFLRSGLTSGWTQMGGLVFSPGPSVGLLGAPRSFHSTDLISED